MIERMTVSQLDELMQDNRPTIEELLQRLDKFHELTRLALESKEKKTILAACRNMLSISDVDQTQLTDFFR